MTAYSVQDYVEDIRAIVAEEAETEAITERIKPLALRLASDPSWFEDKYRYTDPEQGVGLHLLHEEDNHDVLRRMVEEPSLTDLCFVGSENCVGVIMQEVHV